MIYLLDFQRVSICRISTRYCFMIKLSKLRNSWLNFCIHILYCTEDMHTGDDPFLEGSLYGTIFCF